MQWTRTAFLLLVLAACGESASVDVQSAEQPAAKPSESPLEPSSAPDVPVVDEPTPTDAAPSGTTFLEAVDLGDRGGPAVDQAEPTPSDEPIVATDTSEEPTEPTTEPLDPSDPETGTGSSATVTAPDMAPWLRANGTGLWVGAGPTVNSQTQEFAVRVLETQADVQVSLGAAVLVGASIEASDAVALALTPLRASYDAGEAAHVLAVVRDEQQAPVSGVTVVGDLDGQPGECTTDGAGACVLTFDTTFGGGSVNATAGDAAASTSISVTEVAVPSGDAIGVQLPTRTLAAGDTFDVPVRLSTVSATPGAYDMRLVYDPAHLSVVSVSPGSCAGMGYPVSNAADADLDGILRFNAITSNASLPCLTTAADAHVATVTFEVLDDSTAATSVGCLVQDYLGYNFNPLGDTCTGAGSLALGAAEPVTLVLSVADRVLDDRHALDGTVQSTSLQTLVAWSDGTVSPVAATLSVDTPGVIELDGAVASAGSVAGVATVTATAFELTASTQLTTRRVTAVELFVADDTLDRIEGTDTIQPTTLQVLAHWEDPDGPFVADATMSVDGRLQVPTPLVYDSGLLYATDESAAEVTVTLPGLNGANDTTATITISDETAVLHGLAVFAVCAASVDISSDGTSMAVTVSDDAVPGVPCALQTHAWFSDGAHGPVPAAMGVAYAASGSASTSGETVTTATDGIVAVEATWLTAAATTSIQ